MSFRTTKEASRPSQEAVDLIRESIAQIHPDDPAHNEWLEVYGDTHATRLAYDLDMVKNSAENGQMILEIGAAPMFLTQALSSSGYNIDAVDLAPERFSQTLKTLGLNVVKCDIETNPLPFKDSSYDLVLFNEMFEHLRMNPIFTMSEILRVLRPGGIIQLSTPNGRSLNRIKNYLVHGRTSDIYSEYEKLSSLGHMGHVREYTCYDVVTFLEHIGFKVDEVVYRESHALRTNRAIEWVFPKLRAFISVVAERPA